MSELGDLLEQLVGTEMPFQSLCGVFRVWRHTERARAAQIAFAEKTGGSFGLLNDGAEPRAVEVQSTLRIWRERARARTDRYLAGELVSRGIRVERSWWAWSGRHGERHGSDDQHEVSGVGRELATLLEPTRLLHALILDAHEPAVVAGRAVVRVRAGVRERMAAGKHARASDLHGVGLGAERYVLDFDRERGVLLGARAEHGGQPFQAIEALEATFDGPVDPDTFTLPGSPGQTPGA